MIEFNTNDNHEINLTIDINDVNYKKDIDEVDALLKTLDISFEEYIQFKRICNDTIEQCDSKNTYKFIDQTVGLTIKANDSMQRSNILDHMNYTPLNEL